MAVKLIHAPSFQQLQEQLISDLHRCDETDPLSPRWVLTPTSTSANNLRRQLAQNTRATPLGGVRVLPLSRFLNNLVERAFQTKGSRWEPFQDFLLMELVAEAAAKSGLTMFRESPTSFALLRPTFLDLADGGFGPDQLEILTELANEPDLTPLERGTLRLYQRWVAVLDASDLTWEPLLQQTLPTWILESSVEDLYQAMSAEAGQTPRLYIHGFYDFTDINLETIAGLGKQCSIDLYYPFVEGRDCHPAFSFSRPVLDDLKIRLGSSLIETRSTEIPADQATSFFLQSYPEGEVPAQPDYITFQHASGVQAEAVSAAQRIRTWMDSNPAISPDDILLVAPDIETYYGTVAEVFADFAIPLRVADLPLTAQKQIDPLQQLYRIWSEGAPLDWVLTYLRDFPGAARRFGFYLDHFEPTIRNLPVTGGFSWEALSQFCEENTEEELKETLSFTTDETKFIKKVAELVSKRQNSFSAREALDLLESMATWLEDPTIVAPVSEAVEAMRSESSIPREALAVILEAAVQDETFSDLVDRPGVLLVPLMRARGLTGRAVVLLGLSCNRFPSRIEEDPLLSDESRRRLRRKAGQVGHRLPVKSHATDEMSLLFFLLNTSAERVHWVIPETDETGRSVSPNPWVLRYLQQWRNPTSTESMPSRIPRSPIEQARCLYALDPQQGSLLPPRFADFLDCDFPRPSLGPGGKVLEPVARIERRAEWYGEIASAAFTEDIPDQRVSVTRLETLARCPFRFWASNIAYLESIAPPESREELDALTWGSLVHKVLENALRPVEGARKSLNSTATRLLGKAADRLEQHIQSAIREAEIEFRLRPAVFRTACEVRLRKTIHAYLQAIVDGECSDGIPLQTEVMAKEVIPALGSLRLSGQMDRIDRLGESIRIIDYKSGRLPWKGAKAKEQALGLGFVLQPLLYPLLYTAQSGTESAPEFCYIFLGEQPPAEESIARESYPPKLIESLAELMRGGFFFPTSNQALEKIGLDRVRPCAWCDFDSLCRRFEFGRSSSSMNFLHRKVPGRFSGIKIENG